jgi:pilus assembly protein FimV
VKHYKRFGLTSSRAAVVASLALGLSGAFAAALELGSARLVSAPGAALEIDVALLAIGPGELEALKPQLPASSRSAALASASIALVQSSAGTPVLRIRNATPVTADDVQFVVVADWGRGRTFREYVVSLSAPAAPEPAAASPLAAATTSTPATTPATPTAAQPVVRLVRRNETLMSISREWSATTGVTLPQAMVGIYRANPTAFGRAGMSEMIVGSILTMPDAATLNAISPTAASNEVSRTLGIWRTGGATSARLSAPAPGTQTLTTAPSRATTSAPAAAPAPVAPSPAAKTLTPPPAAAAKPAITATPTPTTTPASAPAPAETPVATPLALEPVAPAVPETPEAKAARLEAELSTRAADLEAAAAEVEALKARLAAAEAASGAGAPGQGGWMAEARRWAAEAWWSIPALGLISLVLLIAFLVRGRRSAAPQPDPEPRQEMTYDLPALKPAKEADPLLDAPLRVAPERVATAAMPSISTAPPILEEDLEGDPPPVDEAGSKINLARAFIEMGQHDAAILELQAALRLGDETQRAEAIRLLDSLPKS